MGCSHVHLIRVERPIGGYDEAPSNYYCQDCRMSLWLTFVEEPQVRVIQNGEGKSNAE